MDGVKVVLFDLDNTLLDRTRTFGGFTHSLLGRYLSHVENTQAIFDRIMELDQDGYKDKAELFSELLEELPWLTKPRHEELMDFYKREYVSSAILMDRARDVIDHTNRTYMIGLITNGKTEIQYGKIDRLGIRDAFGLILVSEEAGIKKPDPRIFQRAVEHFQVKPEECLYIGDHPQNDIEGAAKVGMQTIWCRVNQPWPDELTVKPKHTIGSLDELLKLI